MNMKAKGKPETRFALQLLELPVQLTDNTSISRTVMFIVILVASFINFIVCSRT